MLGQGLQREKGRGAAFRGSPLLSTTTLPVFEVNAVQNALSEEHNLGAPEELI
jgi:hypothetical protein